MAGARSCSEGKIAGLYDLERTLGKGHFAVVKLARHVFTGERVAVKVIDKSKLDGEAAAQLLQEEQGVVKLTDFGFSNRFQPGTMLTTSCGSLTYSAPEILLGDEYDAPAVGKNHRLSASDLVQILMLSSLFFPVTS
uniref:non-specific serine/threonine protein kinase n=1 Tax=Sphenodon punctatus TaxID=8508 RepID=A0A8D0GET7_SPHPU